MPTKLSDITVPIFQWFKREIGTDKLGNPIYCKWAKDNQQIDSSIYGVLNMTGNHTYGIRNIKPSNNDPDSTLYNIEFEKKIFLTCSVFADDIEYAMDKILNISSSLDIPTVVGELGGAGLSVVAVSDEREITLDDQTMFIPQAQFDVEFGWVYTQIRDLGNIRHIDASGIVDIAKINGTLDDVVTLIEADSSIQPQEF